MSCRRKRPIPPAPAIAASAIARPIAQRLCSRTLRHRFLLAAFPIEDRGAGISPRISGQDLGPGSRARISGQDLGPGSRARVSNASQVETRGSAELAIGRCRQSVAIWAHAASFAQLLPPKALPPLAFFANTCHARMTLPGPSHGERARFLIAARGGLRGARRRCAGPAGRAQCRARLPNDSHLQLCAQPQLPRLLVEL
jgi:hypothetical protein